MLHYSVAGMMQVRCLRLRCIIPHTTILGGHSAMVSVTMAGIK